MLLLFHPILFRKHLVLFELLYIWSQSPVKTVTAGMIDTFLRIKSKLCSGEHLVGPGYNKCCIVESTLYSLIR